MDRTTHRLAGMPGGPGVQRLMTAMATAALACLTLGATADAQRSTGRGNASAGSTDERLVGVMFGVHTIAAPGVSLTGDEEVDGFRTGFGSGVGVMVGYGFNRTFTGFASLDIAKQGSGMSHIDGSFGLVHLEIGARANFPTRNARTVPYASASIGRRAIGARVTDLEWDEESEFSFSGSMLALGGGVQHFLTTKTAIDAGLTLGFGSFSEVEYDGESHSVESNSSTSVRLRVGVTWRP